MAIYMIFGEFQKSFINWKNLVSFSIQKLYQFEIFMDFRPLTNEMYGKPHIDFTV